MITHKTTQNEWRFVIAIIIIEWVQLCNWDVEIEKITRDKQQSSTISLRATWTVQYFIV